MKLSLDENTTSYQIQRVDSNSITVNNKVYSQNIIVMSNKIVVWDVTNFANLQVSDFQQLCDLQPELVLLGTGNISIFPATELLVPLIEAKIGLEIMNTIAACHTYTLLRSEGRKVAAALLL